jgi:hypothetical protein
MRFGAGFRLAAGAGFRLAAGAALPLVVAALFAWIALPSRWAPGWPEARARLDAMVAVPVEAHAERPWLLAALALTAQEDRRLTDRVALGRSIPIDPRACARALAANLRAGGVREGCSTLAMGLAGMALGPTDGERGWTRKLAQVRLAWTLTGLAPDRLVGHYLAHIPCGTDLTEGLEGCALLHFGRRVTALTDAEAVLLASAVQAPSLDLRDPERARRRVDRVGRAMLELGWIDPGTAAAIEQSPIRLGRMYPDYVRAWRRDLDLAWTAALGRSLAAIDPLLAKDPDLVRVAAVFDARGELVGTAGASAWLDMPFEAGSWMKPWCAASMAEVAGPAWLESAPVPLRLPLRDRGLRSYHPRNVGHALPALATPAEWLMRSVNTGNLGAWLVGWFSAPPEVVRDALAEALAPSELAAWSAPRDRSETARLYAAWTGTTLPDETVAILPGIRALTTTTVRRCLARVRADVGPVDVPGDDLSTLLGLAEAPLRGWGHGFAALWIRDGAPTPIAEAMQRWGPVGTLKSVARRVPGGLPYKTATARRSVGIAARFEVATADGGVEPVVVIFALARPSGSPIRPWDSGALAPALHRLVDILYPAPGPAGSAAALASARPP